MKNQIKIDENILKLHCGSEFKKYYAAIIEYLNCGQSYSRILGKNVDDFEIKDIEDWRIKYTYNYVNSSLINQHIGYDILSRIQVYNSLQYIESFYNIDHENFTQDQFPQNVMPKCINEETIKILSYVKDDRYDEKRFLIIFNLLWKMFANLGFIENTIYMKKPCGYHGERHNPNKSQEDWEKLRSVIIQNMKRIN